jgi:hypothetical protein
MGLGVDEEIVGDCCGGDLCNGDVDESTFPPEIIDFGFMIDPGT